MAKFKSKTLGAGSVNSNYYNAINGRYHFNTNAVTIVDDEADAEYFRNNRRFEEIIESLKNEEIEDVKPTEPSVAKKKTRKKRSELNGTDNN